MTAPRRLLASLLAVLALAACSSTPSTASTSDVTLELDNRPFRVHVPPGYDPATKAPLLVLLHGYTSNATEIEDYFRVKDEADRRGFLYALPEGTENREKKRFWNATAACCDFFNSGVDDSRYLIGVVDTVAAKYSVDPARVYFAGHSNGGFMALRMACDHADRVTAVVSLAGAAAATPSLCTPDRAVSVLQIHGTADRTILYDGGPESRPYPSAEETVALWRRLDGCTDHADKTPPPLDVDDYVAGAETTVTTYNDGCRDGARAELWSIKDGSHIPALTPAYATALADFLLARTAPTQ